jgi:hypothetical protein
MKTLDAVLVGASVLGLLAVLAKPKRGGFIPEPDEPEPEPDELEPEAEAEPTPELCTLLEDGHVFLKGDEAQWRTYACGDVFAAEWNGRGGAGRSDDHATEGAARQAAINGANSVVGPRTTGIGGLKF